MDMEFLKDVSEAMVFDANRLDDIFATDNEGIIQESAEEILVLIEYLQNSLNRAKTELGIND